MSAVKSAVIGLGRWGRDHVNAMAGGRDMADNERNRKWAGWRDAVRRTLSPK